MTGPFSAFMEIKGSVKIPSGLLRICYCIMRHGEWLPAPAATSISGNAANIRYIFERPVRHAHSVTLPRSTCVSHILKVAYGYCSRSRSRAIQHTRMLLSEALADPRLMSGTMANSRTVTSERTTRNSSTSRIVFGGLKFHCWCTISRNECPPSGDHRRMNSCVRSVSVSSKTSAMRLSLCGWSKSSRIV